MTEPDGRRWSTRLDDGRTATVVATDRRDGDLSIHQDLEVVTARRRAIVDSPWTWLRQVHGADVVHVRHPGDGAGRAGDALVTTASDAPMSVQIADCAPVAFVDAAGVVAVAHAGWRGLAAGVLQHTVAAMAELGATAPVAVLGPCIRPAAYEFGASDLDRVVATVGPEVRSTTAEGRPALDVPAGVRALLARLGVPVVADIGTCTAADEERWWSHRARHDPERQAVVVWMSG